jgi:hypothetical protein
MPVVCAVHPVASDKEATMGRLGRNVEKFGQNIGERVGDLRSNVSDRLGDLGERVGEMSGEEGTLTRGIEKITSSLPSTTWLMFAGVSILGSLGLKLFGKDKTANFVGQWAPTFLLLGVYNKLVKLHGSDRR